jgi:hypothetical protein
MSDLICIVFCLVCGQAKANEPPCKHRRDLAGSCFSVRGNLQLFNGTPSARIDVSGSHRILGVEPWFENGNETFSAPRKLRSGASFERAIRGMYFVCPLSASIPGRMQSVCIAKGSLSHGPGGNRQ